MIRGKRPAGKAYAVYCVMPKGETAMTFVRMFGQGWRAKPPPLKNTREFDVEEIEPFVGPMSDKEREACHVPVGQ